MAENRNVRNQELPLALTNPAKALAALEARLAELSALVGLSHEADAFKVWRDATTAAVRKAFGPQSDEASRFARLTFLSLARPWDRSGLNLLHRQEYDSAMAQAEPMLREFVSDLKGQAQPGAGHPGSLDRTKSEKFGILDSPSLTAGDVSSANGPRGTAFIYLDLDGFKAFNTKYTERTVDRDLLPPVQQLIADIVLNIGLAYAEGGDEITILLPNASRRLAIAVAEEIRLSIAEHKFNVSGETEQLTASLGLAHVAGGQSDPELQDRANEAKRAAKESGKNKTCEWTSDGCVDVRHELNKLPQ